MTTFYYMTLLVERVIKVRRGKLVNWFLPMNMLALKTFCPFRATLSAAHVAPDAFAFLAPTLQKRK